MSKAVILSIGLSILVAGPLSAQWFQQNSGVTFTLYDVDFVDTLHGVVTGSDIQHLDTTFVTTDGGNAWQHVVRTGSGGLGRLSMVTPYRGWAVDSDSFVTTTDGGFTWKATSIIPFGMGVNGLSFVDTLHGWAVGGTITGTNYIIATLDGGYTWSQQAVNIKRDLFDVMFVDTLHGYACGYDGGADTLSIVATTDGGRTWVKQRTPDMSPALAVFFLDSLRGWAVGEDPHLIYTTNGGQSWDWVPVGPHLNDIVFGNSIYGWAVGQPLSSAVILVSTNGGLSWASQTPGVTNELMEVDFVGPRKGWIVGKGGVILHTDNGGGAVGVEEAGQGDKETRRQGDKFTVYPNPSRKEIKLRIRVTKASLKTAESRLQVYDINGRLVRDLTQALRQGHQEEILWDGKDEKGKAVPSGTYLVKLNVRDNEQSRRIVVIR